MNKLTQWMEEAQRRRRLEFLEAENERLKEQLRALLAAAESVTAVITTPDGCEQSISFLEAMRQGGVSIPVGPPQGRD